MSSDIGSGRRPGFGIWLKLISVALFVLMAACVKLAGELPAGQLLFFRFLFGLIPLLVILAWNGRIRNPLHTRNPLGHVWRGIVGGTSMGLSFFALTKLPLAEAILLSYAMPLFVVILGAIFLKEVVRPFKWLCVALGLAGMAVIVLSHISLAQDATIMSSAQAWGIAAALMGAATGAWAMPLVKQLVRTEPSSTIVLWFSLTATAFSLLTAVEWKSMGGPELALMLAAGLLGGLAQILMTESYRHADASTIAPFDYMSAVFSLFLGYCIFGDVPSLPMMGGGAIVVAAGMLLALGEMKLVGNAAR